MPRLRSGRPPWPRPTRSSTETRARRLAARAAAAARCRARPLARPEPKLEPLPYRCDAGSPHAPHAPGARAARGEPAAGQRTGAGAGTSPAQGRASKPVAPAAPAAPAAPKPGRQLSGQIEGPSVVVDAAQMPKPFSESPLFAELVKQGKLPPVDQRLPQEPPVIKPSHEAGQVSATRT